MPDAGRRVDEFTPNIVVSAKHVTIIGGGITGLSTAYYLQERAREAGQPIRCTLLEAGPRLGGKVGTEQVDGYLIEAGPDSFITQKPWALDLCRELGLTDQLVPCNEARQTVYVLRNGRLVRLPSGLRLTVPTKVLPFLLTPLLSPLGKLRMACEPFIPPRKTNDDESLASFIRRRLGQEALDVFAAPIMAGIYVSDAEQMSMQSTFPMFPAIERRHRSLLLAMWKRKRQAAREERAAPPMFVSLRGGMQELTDTLASHIEDTCRTGCRVTSLSRRAKGFCLQVEGGEDAELQTDVVVLATPASTSARLLRPLHESLADRLNAIRYVSTAVVVLAYPPAALPPEFLFDGFGFLVPRNEAFPIVACTCSSNKFPRRAPPGHALFRVFVGGPGREKVVEQPDDDLSFLARQTLEATLGVRGTPAHTRVLRWTAGNPQYDVGHLDRVKKMDQLASEIPGLHLAGSSYHGVGLPDCIHSGQRAAERISL